MQLERHLPNFDNAEIDAIRLYLGELSPVELKAIILRFWGSYSINDIAKELRQSWPATDAILDRAILALRKACMRDPIFSKLVLNAAA